MYIVNLIRKRDWEHTTWVDTFLVEDHVGDPEAAFRNAIREYLQTEDGRESIENSCYDFNWGDALNDVPDEIWARHGLRINYGGIKTVDVIVDQDEVLCDDIDWGDDDDQE